MSTGAGPSTAITARPHFVATRQVPADSSRSDWQLIGLAVCMPLTRQERCVRLYLFRDPTTHAGPTQEIGLKLRAPRTHRPRRDSGAHRRQRCPRRTLAAPHADDRRAQPVLTGLRPRLPSRRHPHPRGQHEDEGVGEAAHTTAAATGTRTLSYGGGVDGIGVQSGHSKVYLVFYGTQWGTQRPTRTAPEVHRRRAGAAGAAQQMFKGIGTNSELWSADLTQWCDGPGVATRRDQLPGQRGFIPYQSGGVLSGVWYDNSKASPRLGDGRPARARKRSTRPPTSATPPRPRTATPTTSSCPRTAPTRTTTRARPGLLRVARLER